MRAWAAALFLPGGDLDPSRAVRCSGGGGVQVWKTLESEDMERGEIEAAFAALLAEREVGVLLEACGATECHLVGGVLRDRALGLPTRDLDAVVAGRGREIAELLAARLPARLVALGGKDFAAYRLVSEGLVVDLWDRAGMALHADLARRDFTVNSFALEPRGGVVSDPFGGLADLARRRLRATTAHSFSGDPLRVLRLARLLAKLPGFTADPETVELARQAAPRLPEVAAERVRDELWQLLSAAWADQGLLALAAVGLYPGLWTGRPGEPCGAEDAAGPAAAAAAAAAELAALDERAADLRRLIGGAACAAADATLDLPAARLALATANLPPGCGSPVAAATRLLEAGYVTERAVVEVVALLGELALPPARPDTKLDEPALPPALPPYPETELQQRRFLFRLGRRWTTVACLLGARAATLDADPAAAGGGVALARWRPAVAALGALLRREGAALFAPPRLLTGTELQELLGLPPGPPIGRALAALTAAQVDGRVHTREDALREIRRWQAMGGH
ncbi:MAG TPA: hypothetical protein VHR45_15430 [Thermoanaerobaculia bacterium]|nr:hypothetical protein [Thermoanaerobaculia bacterium]